jgi:hypothetical protein
MKIVTMHKHEKSHLEDVKKYASEIGSVKIHSYFDGETIYCLEGVHRVQAAFELQIPIIFECLQWDSNITTDIEDLNCNSSVEEIFEYAYSRSLNGNVYDKDDFGIVEVVNG